MATYPTSDVTGTAIHGYISGATVFADENGNGSLDAGESSAITDALGHFLLKNASGPLISIGGVDTSTNLPITIKLEAPAGSTVITPLTTLINLLLPANATAADVAATEATVAKGLGISLSSGQSLLTLDTVAGTISGDSGATDAYLTAAKIYDTISVLSAGLSNQGGVSAETATGSIVSALADKITAAAAAGQTVDLNSTATLQQVLTSGAAEAGTTVGSSALASISNIAASSNTAMDTAVAGVTNGRDVFLASSAVQQVAEGSTTKAILNNPQGQPLATVETQYTGTNLNNAVSDAADNVSTPAESATSGKLLIQLSGDQFAGNPEFKVYVDGKLVTGNLSAIGGSGTSSETGVSASHAQGQWQTFTVDGAYDTKVSHHIGVSLSNDAYGGSTTLDRNLYVGNITIAGQAVIGSSNEVPAPSYDGTVVNYDTPIAGTVHPLVSGTDTLTIQLSGDKWIENPTVLVYVDGNLVDGTLSGIGGTGTSTENGVSASHAQNQWQTFTVKGGFDPSVAHTVQVAFTNDGWNGNAAEDRNLYVGNITLNGQAIAGVSNDHPVEKDVGGTVTFTTTPTSSNGTGQDTAPGGTGHDTAPGGSASDTLSGGTNYSHSYLIGGQSHLYSGPAGDTLYGGLSAGAHDTLVAGSGDDLLSVKQGDNTLWGGTGLDTLMGGSGHDTLYGGGQSALYAGSGGDTLFGGLSAGGHDTLNSGAGNDFLMVTQGNNVLFGGAGLDTLMGGSGHDTLYGGGQSAMFAGSGGDTLYGGLGTGAHDTLMGGAGNDYLSVTQGNNALHATGGMDTLHAGSGNDTLYSGFGDAKLYGGSGHTTFEISATAGNDTIVGGAGSNSVIIDGHSSTDAHYKANTDGSTTITFTGSSQSITTSNIDSLHFSVNNNDHKIG